jgi:hypothetical protein
MYVTDFEEGFSVKSFAIDFQVSVDDALLSDIYSKLNEKLPKLGAYLLSLKGANQRAVIEFSFPDNLNANDVKSLINKELMN